MPDSASICSWLVYSALVSLVVLTLGSAAVLLCRQPTRRLRIIELTLLGCLIAPWPGMIPGYPHVAVGLWKASPPERHEAPAIPSTEPASLMVAPQADAAPRAVSDSRWRSIAEPVEAPAAEWNVGAWIVALYLFGVAIGLAWWLAGVAAVVRILRGAHAAPPRCRQLLAEIAGRHSDRVRLLTSRRAKQPFASVGVAVQLAILRATWRRAVIVLPEDLCDDEQAVRWALAHEWTHVERHHFRAWFVAAVAQVLLYYQPLVWWLRRHLRLCQDFLADAHASREAPQPEDYAEFLTVRAAAGSLHPAMVGLGMGFRRSDLHRRVIMLVQNPPLESRTPRLWNALVSLAALALIGILPALTFTPESVAQEEERAPQRKPAARSSESPNSDDRPDAPAREQSAPADPAATAATDIRQIEKPVVGKNYVILPITTNLQRAKGKAYEKAKFVILINGSALFNEDETVLNTAALGFQTLRKTMQAQAEAGVRGDTVIRICSPLPLPHPMDWEGVRASHALKCMLEHGYLTESWPGAVYVDVTRPSRNWKYANDWESLVADVTQPSPEGAVQQEAGVGDDQVKLYAVRTPLSRFLFFGYAVPVDCVVHIIPPIEEAKASAVLTMQHCLPELNLKTKNSVCFLESWRDSAAANLASEDLTGRHVWKDLLGFRSGGHMARN